MWVWWLCRRGSRAGDVATEVAVWSRANGMANAGMGSLGRKKERYERHTS